MYVKDGFAVIAGKLLWLPVDIDEFSALLSFDFFSSGRKKMSR